MATFSELVGKVSQAAYQALIMARHKANKVPTDSWVSLVNFGLSLTEYSAELFAQLRALATETFRVFFVEEWVDLLDESADDAERQAIEDRITIVARNLYGTERGQPQLQLGRFVVLAAAGAPSQSIGSGIAVGTPGPNGLIWYSEDGDDIKPGERRVVMFRAAAAGSEYNVPLGTPLEFKTTMVGLSVMLDPSGPGTEIGTGNAGLLVFANNAGVSLELVNLGASQPLSISFNIVTGEVTIGLRTNGGGMPISTADEVRQFINEQAAIVPLGSLLICAKNLGTGTGTMQVTGSLIPLEWDGGYIEEAGAEQEPAARLGRRCTTRLDTLGGGGGDGAPSGAVGTEDALVYWGLQVPAGYSASPVRWVRVLSNHNLGAMSGGASTVVLASQGGPVSLKDVNAVAGNYENPKKYWGDLYVVSATVLPILLVGTVYIRARSGKTPGEIQTAIAKSLADFIELLGEEWSQNEAPIVYPQKIGSRVEDADKNAIARVDLSSPTTPTTLAWNEFPGFDISGLVFVVS